MSQQTPNVTVRSPREEDAPRIAELFDRYRVFYGQQSQPQEAEAFIRERLRHGDSAMFVAEMDGKVEGFIQLYQSLSSVAMGKIWILNDLYVTEDVRGHGVGMALLEQAHRFAKETGAARITVSTARDNRAAMELYQKMGWRPDEFFVHYHLAIEE